MAGYKAIEHVRNTLKQHKLAVSCVVILFFFFLSRQPFFTHFFIPGCYVSDTFEYFKVALEMKNGQWPLFEFRSPGYPLFIYLLNLLSDKIIAVVIAQNVITLFSIIFLIYSVNRTYNKLTYAVCFAMVFFITGNNSIEADSSVVTNSLFASCLITYTALLILALERNKYWILISLLVGWMIYIRPSGLFIIPIIVLLGIFLLLSKDYPKVTVVKLFLPLTLMLLALSFYNQRTLGIFAISPFGGLALSGAVITFMEPSPEYSDCENSALAKLDTIIRAEDRQLVRTSSDIHKLHPVFFNNHYNSISFYKDVVRDCGFANFPETLPTIKKVSLAAVKNHPDYYLKFVITGLYHFIVDGNLTEHQLFYYSEVQRRYEHVYIKKKPQSNQFFATYVPDLIPVDIKKFAYREFYNPVADEVGLNRRNENLKSSIVFKVFDIYTLKFNRIFLRNWFWPLTLIAIFLFSGIKLLLSRFSNREALIVFVICCLHVCSALLICLVEPSFYVYTYMTEFVYFLAVASAPLLFFSRNRLNSIR